MSPRYLGSFAVLILAGRRSIAACPANVNNERDGAKRNAWASGLAEAARLDASGSTRKHRC